MIQHQIQGEIVLINGLHKSAPVQIDMVYDFDEPLTVEMTFSQPETLQEPVTWLISRDLMMDSLVKKGVVGQQDVRFRYSSPLDGGSGVLYMTLASPEGVTTMKIPYAQTALFLAETAKVVPRGQENLADQLDAFLGEVLG